MYAKEHFRPQLHQLDQDKLARLYADLRRESLATGSFPITVRHLESMIRMAEASAKMHLREYVRTDDIDLAIQVAVGSFVSAQKMSIKKTLERVSFTFSSMYLHLANHRVLRASENMSTKPPITKNSCHSFWVALSRKRSNFTATLTERTLRAYLSRFHSSRGGQRNWRSTMFNLSSEAGCSLLMGTKWWIMTERGVLKRRSQSGRNQRCL